MSPLCGTGVKELCEGHMRRKDHAPLSVLMGVPAPTHKFVAIKWGCVVAKSLWLEVAMSWFPFVSSWSHAPAWCQYL